MSVPLGLASVSHCGTIAMALSNSNLKQYVNKPQRKRFDLTDRDGLAAKISELGRVTFQYRYRFQGKSKRLSLGRFPDMTLAQAREKIPQLRQLLK